MRPALLSQDESYRVTYLVPAKLAILVHVEISESQSLRDGGPSIIEAVPQDEVDCLSMAAALTLIAAEDVRRMQSMYAIVALNRYRFTALDTLCMECYFLYHS
jgi:hypothetical protein